MCPSAPRVCSEPGGQKPVLSLSLDLIAYAYNDLSKKTVLVNGMEDVKCSRYMNWYQLNKYMELPTMQKYVFRIRSLGV